MGDTRTVLMFHKDVVFENQVVYTTGHAYNGCTFRRCTMVYRGGPGLLEHCSFDGCVWHIDLLVFDSSAWDDFMASTAFAITKSLPRVKD